MSWSELGKLFNTFILLHECMMQKKPTPSNIFLENNLKRMMQFWLPGDLEVDTAGVL